MTRNRRVLPITAAILLTTVLFMGADGCDKARSAAVAINKYAVALDGAQKVEIEAFHSGLVSKDEHRTVQQGFLRAATTGRALNDSLVTALQGGDPVAQLDAASRALDGLTANVDLIKDVATRQKVQLAVAALRPLLLNTISLIQAVRRG